MRGNVMFKMPYLQSRDEIADAYDYWVHTHRRIDFDYKDAGKGLRPQKYILADQCPLHRHCSFYAIEL